MTIKKITWRDSTLYLEEEDKNISWEVTVIESIGFVVKETDSFIVLTGDMMGDGYRRSIVIPRENIVSEELL